MRKGWIHFLVEWPACRHVPSPYRRTQVRCNTHPWYGQRAPRLLSCPLVHFWWNQSMRISLRSVFQTLLVHAGLAFAASSRWIPPMHEYVFLHKRSYASCTCPMCMDTPLQAIQELWHPFMDGLAPSPSRVPSIFPVHGRSFHGPSHQPLPRTIWDGNGSLGLAFEPPPRSRRVFRIFPLEVSIDLSRSARVWSRRHEWVWCHTIPDEPPGIRTHHVAMDRKSKLNDMADVLLNDDEEDEVRPGRRKERTCAWTSVEAPPADDEHDGGTDLDDGRARALPTDANDGWSRAW